MALLPWARNGNLHPPLLFEPSQCVCQPEQLENSSPRGLDRDTLPVAAVAPCERADKGIVLEPSLGVRLCGAMRAAGGSNDVETPTNIRPARPSAGSALATRVLSTCSLNLSRLFYTCFGSARVTAYD